VTEHRPHARLVNAESELIAEGPCFVDETAGQATLEAEREPGVIQRARGRLTLELDTGRSLVVSDKPMIVRLRQTGAGSRGNGGRTMYRLRLIEDAQEAVAVGAAREGTPAPPEAGPSASGLRETPAAR
jgi:hypothetical protein